MCVRCSDAAQPAQEELGGWPEAAGLQEALSTERDHCRGHASPGRELSQGAHVNVCWAMRSEVAFGFLS